MEKQEYLSEERYQQTKGKIKNVGIILLIVGGILAIVGIVFLVLGFGKFGNIFNDVTSGNSFTSNIGSMFDSVLNDSSSVSDIIQDSVDEFNNSANNTQTMAKNGFGAVGMFALGGFVLMGSLVLMGIGVALMVMAHRREIKAFAVQQTMPIAQEGIEKMAPTVGSAVGTIGKELAKGIKEGINDADKE